ncbi:unnamed protein product [Oreochromis niloticus]|nr:unnamed protein product [Mustela putorius furo]
MLVKFTDNAGILEEGLDAGGPKQEFLSLLMKHMKDRPIFDGPEGHRFLVYNAKAVREDEYYLAGKMIAVSVVHGGPGPHFLSEELVHYLAGQTSVKATVASVTDGDIGKALQEYIIARNSSVIDRFKEGLSALNFLSALQQHPTLLSPVLCHMEKKLTALELERLFKPDFSPSGSNRRHLESQTVGYWSDYLLDCEESQTAVSVGDVLMFATGLTSVPPSGLDPLPSLQFLDDSLFPMANTCLNLSKLPLITSYSVFKSNMDFGIQNSPGFGCF